MNIITKQPLEKLGYQFIEDGFLPEGKTEYYLRDLQRPLTRPYRRLKGDEIEILVHNNNTAGDWNDIWVSEEFNPLLVKHCQFYGQVRIGRLEPFYLEFHNIKLPVGLYDSTICSCDIGDNVVIDNVGYLAHYIIGNQSILANIDEMSTTDYAKFGNGILKDGEMETQRIWLEICNENGGRKVMPFDGMLAADAWLWAKYRDRPLLLDQFKKFTEKVLDAKRGYYGSIGNYTVIKNCKVIKDVRVGDHAYLKGANKLKNMTINSTAEAPSQIGEGCEMVNGIMEAGCRAFYGIKAVRFIMASHSNLKYGARLINSYLGSNATVSCCEVLNSLIFPSHEQHHNTSFLIATTLLGQSNVAAGATIGSNHNSRGADGELIAGRGFWPGLSVTLKHNSRFASFTLIMKGNYNYEIDLKIPFCIVSNDESKNELVIYPAYWFDHNLYALARNTSKFKARDLRKGEVQPIVYEYLAPDSVQEMCSGVLYLKSKVKDNEDIYVTGIENSKRAVKIRKPQRAIEIFTELINYYFIRCLVEYQIEHEWQGLPTAKAHTWFNLGGQLITNDQLKKLLKNIETDKILSWIEIHQYYNVCGEIYNKTKLEHALACYMKVHGLKNTRNIDFKTSIKEALKTSTWIYGQIQQSKYKDFLNPFRKMTYDTEAEMAQVLGTFDAIPFFKEAKQNHDTFVKQINKIKI